MGSDILDETQVDAYFRRCAHVQAWHALYVKYGADQTRWPAEEVKVMLEAAFDQLSAALSSALAIAKRELSPRGEKGERPASRPYVKGEW